MKNTSLQASGIATYATVAMGQHHPQGKKYDTKILNSN